MFVPLYHLLNMFLYFFVVIIEDVRIPQVFQSVNSNIPMKKKEKEKKDSNDEEVKEDNEI